MCVYACVRDCLARPGKANGNEGEGANEHDIVDELIVASPVDAHEQQEHHPERDAIVREEQ